MPNLFPSRVLLRRLLLLSLFSVVFPLYAELEALQDEFDAGGENIEEWRFREDVVDLPAYPEEKRLIKLHIDAAESPFNYYIDENSLSIAADETVAYTVVIRSPAGAENILFESIRCDTREYKTHAYATSKKTFYRLHEPQWKRIYQRMGSGQDYRRDLVTAYFCSDVRDTLDMLTIKQRIHDVANIPDESFGY